MPSICSAHPLSQYSVGACLVFGKNLHTFVAGNARAWNCTAFR